METAMTERERFMARLAKARESGLVDLKLFFKPERALSPEQIFAAMNEVEDAIESGRCKTHSGRAQNEVRA
jgi:hypothetical protein